MERCANCDSPTGKLETPHVFNGDVVCATCHRKLTESNTLSEDDLATAVKNEVAATRPREDNDEIRRRMGATPSHPSRPAGPIRTQDSTTGGQRFWAIAACIGVPLLMIGGFMVNASRDGHFDWMEMPGGIMAVIGLILTFGGLLMFAVHRMKA